MRVLTRYALRSPRTTTALVVLFTAVAVWGLPRTVTEVGYRAILGEDHPAVQRLDDLIDTFGGGLPVMAVWSCDAQSPCESAFDDASLRMAESVERSLSSHSLVLRVESPASAPLLTFADGGLSIRQFIERGEIPADREMLAEIAVREPLWQGTLVSADGRVGAIIVQLASSDSETTATIVPALQKALEPHEKAGFEFALLGDPVDFVVSGGAMQRETPRMIPVMISLVFVVILALFRSWVTAALALGTAGIAVVWAMGSMSWLGWPQMELTQPLPAAVLVVGVCAALHVLSRYSSQIAPLGPVALHDRESAMLAVVGDVGPACLVTTLTTAAGFLSFATSGLDSFLRFGSIVAWGIMLALALTFTILPVVLVRIAPRWLRPEAVHGAWEEALRLLLAVVERRSRILLAVTIVLFILSLFGVSRLRVDVDEQELFGVNSPVVQWARFVDERLRKADSLEIELTAPQSITDPRAMTHVAAVVEHLPTVDGLGRTLSLLDLLGPVNQFLHDGDPSYRRSADTRAGNAQLVFTLRSAPGAPIDNWLDFEERRVRLSVEADPLSVDRRADLLGQLSHDLESMLPSDWAFVLTGPLAIYTDFVEELLRTQLRSFATAAVVIAAMLFVFLWLTGSPPIQAMKWTLIALFPSALPVAITLGAMGWLDVPLDVGTAMVAAIVLGIAVDDSVHLIGTYRGLRLQGEDPASAIRNAVRRVGRAVVTTSFALSIGFFTLMMSSWQSVASFGFLSGIAILGALLADLVVLPALVLGFSSSSSTPREPPEITDEPRATARVGGTLLLLGAMAGALGTAGTVVLSTTDEHRLGCSVARGGRTTLAAVLDGGCPLEPHDRIEFLRETATGERRRPGGDLSWLSPNAVSVRADIARHGRRISRSIPVAYDSSRDRALRLGSAALLGGVMTAFALFVLWTSSAPAAVPFSALYACFTVVTTHLLVSPANGLGDDAYLLAMGLLPAILVHLGLTFPHVRPIVSRAPGLLPLAYGVALFASVVSLWAYTQYPALWRIVFSLWAVIACACWLVLLGALLVARRDASTGLERTRSGVSLWGTAAVPFVVLVLGGIGDSSGTALAAFAAALVPAPFGYALSLHQRRDVRPQLRLAATYCGFSVLYVGAVAVGLHGFLSGQNAGSAVGSPYMLVWIFGILLLAHFIGDRLWGYANRHLPTMGRRLQQLEADAAHQMRELRNDEGTAQVLASLIRDGLHSPGVAVWLWTAQGWRLAAAGGQNPPDMLPFGDLAMIEGHGVVDLGIEGGMHGARADDLREAGVALIAPMRQGSDLLAIALVRGPRKFSSYSAREVDFVENVCSLASVSLQNASLTDELLRLERYSTIGRIATALMHDIGRPLTVIRQDAKELLRDPPDLGGVEEIARSTVEQADDALDTIRQLLDHAREGLSGPVSRAPLREVVARAVETVSRRHGDGRIAMRLEPALPAFEYSDELRIALINLLDNALLASSPDELTEICAGVRGARVRIEVIDRGRGMSTEVKMHAFDAFFTTREGDGGRGIGLHASRTTVERLGGTVRIESTPGRGTRVTIEIPIH